jgi:SM-20-related protein
LTARAELSKNAASRLPDLTMMTADAPTSLWPTNDDWMAPLMPDFYQHGLSILPQAIPASLCQALLSEVQQHSDLRSAGVGRQQQLQLNSDIRRDQTAWLDGSTAAQQAYLALMAQLQQQMNRQCFLGLTHHECHFARYQVGDFYQTHLDAFVGRSNRVLTTVLYLNSVDAGGELVIYDEAHTEIQRVLPQAGLLVAFESTRFPHQVLPALQPRFSIAGWFRND